MQVSHAIRLIASPDCNPRNLVHEAHAHIPLVMNSKFYLWFLQYLIDEVFLRKIAILEKSYENRTKKRPILFRSGRTAVISFQTNGWNFSDLDFQFQIKSSFIREFF